MRARRLLLSVSARACAIPALLLELLLLLVVAVAQDTHSSSQLLLSR
jgi:hypothetical protein